MKTIEQLLQELPDPARGRAIANAKRKPLAGLDSVPDKQTVKEALIKAFMWNTSIEGPDYWANVFTWLCDSQTTQPAEDKHDKKITPEQRTELLVASFNGILQTCDRITPGNVSHAIATVRATAVQGLKVLRGEI